MIDLIPALLATAALVAVIEVSPLLRIPTALILAIAGLVLKLELVTMVFLGAATVTGARAYIALNARHRRKKPGTSTKIAANLLRSPAFMRTSFWLGAVPGVPATTLFSLLGTARAPLLPALLGSFVGRLPVLALMITFFMWLGRLGEATDTKAALVLGILGGLLLLMQTIKAVDWAHRAETGEWRMQEQHGMTARITTILHSSEETPDQDPEQGVLEGEIIDVEVDEIDEDSDSQA